jgi:putative transposase
MKNKKYITDFCWQRGYGIFSVSRSQIGIISNYIKDQIQHHKKFSFEDELRMILQKSCMQYDEKYLWN